MDMQGTYGDDFGARGSRRYLRRAVEGSLRRLRTDHVDLLQYHRPDGVTPLEETLTAMHELVVEGKVRYLGTSNLPAWQVADAVWVARTEHLTPFVSEQSEYSLLRRGAEAELLPACAAHGVGFLPYFPLASGLLTGKYRRGEQAPEGSRLAGDAGPSWLTDEAYDVAEAVAGFAADRGRSSLDVAFAALLARPEVSSVIAGATRPEQVAANAAAGAWSMTPEDRAALDQVLPG
jgi:aryl-alcohol dehydrogenase-like predicted oxidoreductase